MIATLQQQSAVAVNGQSREGQWWWYEQLRKIHEIQKVVDWMMFINNHALGLLD
jgi:hypothetical protein